jgi:hypothetical protein
MPEKNTGVTKQEREWVQVIVTGQIEIRKKGDHRRILRRKTLLRARAQCGCRSWVDFEVAQSMSFWYVGVP